jgi:hypothetical protein
MRLQEKSLSKLTLLDLLRRKRKNLEAYLKEAGIVTYDRLVRSCTSIGVIPPTEEQFLAARGNPVTHEVSSPTDGILVLNPPELVEPVVITQEQQEDSSSLEEIVEETPKQQAPKKKKKSVEPDQAT